MHSNFNILYFDEIESTNKFALANIIDLQDKQVISANKQTAGRGRLNRKWISDVDNNLYISIVLKPANKVSEELPIANITQYMSVCICKTLEKYNVNSHIKWPNDVLINNKKIAGILSEASIQGTTLKGVVLGIGINLNLSPKHIEDIDQPATSLNLELNKDIDKQEFINVLLNEFFTNYDNFIKNGFKEIKNDYINQINFIGKNVKINSINATQNGIAKQINDDGSLLITNNLNEDTIITMGDLICQ